jgi:peptidoglycan/LPS O-acetylase OafA/YrhL
MGLVTEGVGQPLAGIVSALLVMACIAGDSEWTVGRTAGVISRAMSSPLLRRIGKYSYAIYLFHTPVRLVLDPYAAPLFESGIVGSRLAALVFFVCVVFAVSYALALVSWRLIEGPALRLKRHFPVGAEAR